MRKAFTLIELLVVVAIIALLIAILLPALSAAKKQGREVVCMSNMRQLALGWLTYANDWNGHLPGSGWDIEGFGWTGTGRTWCWLGTRGDIAGSVSISLLRRFVPEKGTIYKYVNESKPIYRCPEDLAAPQQIDTQRGIRSMPPYSYTAPVILTGAPVELLVRTRWPIEFDNTWDNARDWDKAMGHSPPWMLVEEDAGLHIANVYDSGWSNLDEVSSRHRGKGSVNHADGSASMRAYQKSKSNNILDRRGSLDAWKVYYELTDRRIVTAGTWNLGGDRRPQFGFLRSPDVVDLRSP